MEKKDELASFMMHEGRQKYSTFDLLLLGRHHLRVETQRRDLGVNEFSAVEVDELIGSVEGGERCRYARR